MTVKELIMEVEFDDLLPYLKEIIVGHFMPSGKHMIFFVVWSLILSLLRKFA